MATKTKQKEEEPMTAPTKDQPSEPEPTIEDLPGVGPATAEKLREAGFDELLGIAVMAPRISQSPQNSVRRYRPRSSPSPRRWPTSVDSCPDLPCSTEGRRS